ELAKTQKVEAVGDLMPAIVKQVEAGFSLVDSVYAIAEDWKNLKDPTPTLVDFTTDQARESVRWTASLYLTAWKLSEGIRLPGWLDRAQNDQ
ncbi:MAG: hypothetical protein OXU27_06725, partial [Candidatus Poribacteria bacterium]|nr:hypothetical protein [Candidatus Poribacteria bacterium]